MTGCSGNGPERESPILREHISNGEQQAATTAHAPRQSNSNFFHVTSEKSRHSETLDRTETSAQGNLKHLFNHIRGKQGSFALHSTRHPTSEYRPKHQPP
jgi:hypothetical protein